MSRPTTTYRRRGCVSVKTHFIQPSLNFDALFERQSEWVTVVTGSFHPVYNARRQTTIHARILTFCDVHIAYVTGLKVVDTHFPNPNVPADLDPTGFHATFFMPMMKELAPEGITDLRFVGLNERNSNSQNSSQDSPSPSTLLSVNTTSPDSGTYLVFKLSFMIWHKVARQNEYERHLAMTFPDLPHDLVELIRKTRYDPDIEVIDREENNRGYDTPFKVQYRAKHPRFRVVDIVEINETGDDEGWTDMKTLPR